MVNETVQQVIAATNGVHYIDRIHKLKSYPRYSLPLPKAKNENALMLDIGCGWGRWLVAGAEKNYIPIGIDFNSHTCATAVTVLRDSRKSGYVVCADLGNLPFRTGIFDLVWSFSVIQHVHKDTMLSCLGHINRVLSEKGFSCLEFPNKRGIRNAIGPVKKREPFRDDRTGPHKMAVRYYNIAEYRAFFMHEFGNFQFTNHSFIGIGVLKEDLKYVSAKNKMLCALSLAGSTLTKFIPGLKYLSDSIYIRVQSNKAKAAGDFHALPDFLATHHLQPFDNLNVVKLLRCPKSGFHCVLSEDKSRVLVPEAGLYYPIVKDVPQMFVDTAASL